MVKRIWLTAVVVAACLPLTGCIAAMIPSEPRSAPVAASETVEETAEPLADDLPTEPLPEPADVETVDLSGFTEVSDREFSLIARDATAHVGTELIVYGRIFQLDASSGKCMMLVDLEGSMKDTSFDYTHSAAAVSGDWEYDCPIFDELMEKDHVKLWVTVMMTFTYDTRIGGSNTVPLVLVHDAEILPALTY
ncbi:hypothetical protein [Microbacterium sp. YY-01]|uniref:hypothetical protein n=1 Tax=Microbacterium sp. YY-01 TaxID=3421634 RepID=UPI003D174AE6